MTEHSSEREAFDKWWLAEGEYIRAGGGQYEASFAYGAWMYRAALSAGCADGGKSDLVAFYDPDESSRQDSFVWASDYPNGAGRSNVPLYAAPPAECAPREALTGDARDAARYRCLRNCYSTDERMDVVDQLDEEMDSSLDAAIAKEPK